MTINKDTSFTELNAILVTLNDRLNIAKYLKKGITEARNKRNLVARLINIKISSLVIE